MLIFNQAFKRLLIFLILMLFALLLLYTNYLQEVNFFQNKILLPEFEVDFEVYKLLQETKVLCQDKLKSIHEDAAHRKTKGKNAISSELGNMDLENLQSFALIPPFPDVDLTSIGPVFIEKGLIHLYCQYSFDSIRCTVGGKIPAKKFILKQPISQIQILKQ